MTKKRSNVTTKRKKAISRKKQQALVREPRAHKENTDRSWRDLDSLIGDTPGITLKDEGEVLFHLRRVDSRLAEAWSRDVVMHKGPITIRRVLLPDLGPTHYACVDRRLLWYLKRDPSDPLGASWEGYLDSADDAPSGTIAVVVGRNLVVKKCPPLLEEDLRR